MIKKYLCGIFLLLALASAGAEVPLKDLMRLDGYDEAQLSPDGKYVALRVQLEGQYRLAVIDVAQHKVVKIFHAGDTGSVARYVWSGPGSLVISLARMVGPFDQMAMTGLLNFVNLEPWSTSVSEGSIVRALPDGEHVGLQFDSGGHQIDSNQSLYCRVAGGHRDNCVVSPIKGTYSSFEVDDTGFARYVVGRDVHYNFVSYVRSPEHPDWQTIKVEGSTAKDIWPVGISKDNRYVYLASREDGDHLCLVRQDLNGGPHVKLACDDVADLSHTVFSFDDEEPVAAIFESGIPSVRLLDTQNPARQIVKQLEDAFPGQVAIPVSHTRDGGKVLVRVYSDRNPGEYYVFDTKTMQAEYLVAARDWISPQQMPERRPVHYTARDGRMIYGYLTIPPGRDPKNLPMVTMPHGGPFFIRESWGWDADAAALANHGYLVLQVNFRGSGGFGARFVEEAKQSWDHLMIDDITDGTKWAASQGYADPKRICIFGGSYGGYAALMSAVREPDLYRCTIGYAGVYDLVKHKATTDTTEREQGRNYYTDFVGANDQRLRAASPLTYIDKLKAAVMIAHGKDDQRVPFSQAEELRDALDQRHYPYEWLAKGGEYHGFYNLNNRIELYQMILAFLDRNIGPNAAAPPPPATTVQASAAAGDAAAAAQLDAPKQ